MYEKKYNDLVLDIEKINEEYKKSTFLWGLKPNKYVTFIPKIIKSGKVLDIGAGEGRNAIYLAKRNFDVLALDISKAAIEKLKMLAERENCSVRKVTEDILKFHTNEKFDVVLCIAVLNIFSKEDAYNVIEKMKFFTKPNGLNLITVFTDKGIKHKNFSFFNKKELRDRYKDWNILKCEYYTKYEIHHRPHRHHICALLAKKPKLA